MNDFWTIFCGVGLFLLLLLAAIVITDWDDRRRARELWWLE